LLFSTQKLLFKGVEFAVIFFIFAARNCQDVCPQTKKRTIGCVDKLMTLQYLLNKRCGIECVVQHYTTMLVEVREKVLADALRLQHMATRMYLKPFFYAGMQATCI
jgi:hypothetical protein